MALRSSGQHLAWVETPSSPPKDCSSITGAADLSCQEATLRLRKEEDIGKDISPLGTDSPRWRRVFVATTDLAWAGERGGGVSHWWQIRIFKEVKVKGEQAIHA